MTAEKKPLKHTPHCELSNGLDASCPVCFPTANSAHEALMTTEPKPTYVDSHGIVRDSKTHRATSQYQAETKPLSAVLFKTFDEEESADYRVRQLSRYDAVVESRIDDHDDWEPVDDDAVCAHVYEQALLDTIDRIREENAQLRKAQVKYMTEQTAYMNSLADENARQAETIAKLRAAVLHAVCDAGQFEGHLTAETEVDSAKP